MYNGTTTNGYHVQVSSYNAPESATARNAYTTKTRQEAFYRESLREQASLRDQTSLRVQSSSYLMLQPRHHHDTHQSFLDPYRPITPFVNTTKDVQQYTEKAFKKITGEAFPNNLIIYVCTKAQLQQRYTGTWKEGIQGFSLNRQGTGINEVYVIENRLDQLMLVIGHEIGHVMTPTLPDARDEEAKAYAFEIAWIDTIIEYNIAGLTNAYHHAPAKNGLHDVAFSFVQHLRSQGRKALKIFSELSQGTITITKTLQFLAG